VKGLTIQQMRATLALLKSYADISQDLRFDKSQHETRTGRLRLIAVSSLEAQGDRVIQDLEFAILDVETSGGMSLTIRDGEGDTSELARSDATQK
jgi:hypothetical protein